jgi:hypothetical protein
MQLVSREERFRRRIGYIYPLNLKEEENREKKSKIKLIDDTKQDVTVHTKSQQ